MQRGTRRKYLQAQQIRTRSFLLFEAEVLAAHRNRTRSRFRSINAQDEQKRMNVREMDTVKKVRSRTVVLTANGKVHTREELQVFVHYLNLFVTLQQLLEETPAVLSIGKIGEDHGYTP